MIDTLLNKYLILLCSYCYRFYNLTGCYGCTSLLQAGFIIKIFIIINVLDIIIKILIIINVYIYIYILKKSLYIF